MQQQTGRINIDLVQDILRKAEKFSPFSLDEHYEEAELNPLIANHVWTLFENGYINAEEKASRSDIPRWEILGLTERGQAFLYLIQKESVWRDLSANVYEGTFTINEVESLAQQIDREKQFDAKSQTAPVIEMPNFEAFSPNNVVNQESVTETPLSETISVPPIGRKNCAD